MTSKGNDNSCLLEKWLQLWQEKFDLLIQGTVQCNHFVYPTHHRSQDSKDRIDKIRVFSKLKLEVNVHAAVHQVTECVSRGVLGTKDKATTGQNNSISVRDAFSVWDALLPKHLEPCVLQFVLYLNVIFSSP